MIEIFPRNSWGVLVDTYLGNGYVRKVALETSCKANPQTHPILKNSTACTMSMPIN